MPNSLVQIHQLSFHYNEKRIFKEISLSIPQGKIIAIMGPSGTGKTTLLKLIGGQLKPQRGEILFQNLDIAKISRKKLFQLRKQMGLLFQSSALFTDLTVFDNVAFPLRENTGLSETLIRCIVLMKLELVGLRGASHLMPSQLSGGMARRVALARSIALDPTLMMYDEPFTGLDPISKGVIVQLIKELNQALHMTSIVVSHDVAEVQMIADEIYILSGGQIVSHGTPAELELSTNPEVIQFMKGLPDGQVPFHYPTFQTFQEELSDA